MNRIATERKKLNITQEELAEKLNLSQKSISKYETGARNPSYDTLTQIAKFFNVSTDYLLGLANERMQYGFTTRSESLTLNEDMGNNINYWILKSGYGYDEISEKLGIPEDMLEDYCSGESMPLNILIELSKICGVSTDCLLGLRYKSRPKFDGELPFKFDPEISRRLKEQAQQMGENYSVIADILGIEEKEVNNFFEYGFVPHISVFARIVEHFLVSSDYLLNRTSSKLIVQQDEERLLRAFRALNEDSKIMALSELLKLEREESLVAAKDLYRDSQGKSSPSNGTEGGTMIG
ncbi:MAG: helix-turn-helix domain-containing protein [Lacrimispora sphenoides]